MDTYKLGNLSSGCAGRNDWLRSRIVRKGESDVADGGVNGSRNDNAKVATGTAAAIAGDCGSVGLEEGSSFGEAVVVRESIDFWKLIREAIDEGFGGRDGGGRHGGC